jgi:hypothetical protein
MNDKKTCSTCKYWVEVQEFDRPFEGINKAGTCALLSDFEESELVDMDP